MADVDAAIERLGTEMREQVRQGLLEGIEEADLDSRLAELEAELEKRIRAAFVEASTSFAKADVLRETTRSVTGAGASIVGESISTFLDGLKRGEDTRDDPPGAT
jgi:hypothetical protein